MNVQAFLDRVNSVDLTAFRAGVAQFEADRAEIAGAQERGEKRRDEIIAARRDIRDQRMSGKDAADLLLKGEDVKVLDRNEEHLSTELATIQLALGNLNGRLNDIYEDEKVLRAEAAKAFGDAVQQDLAELEAEASALASQLVEVFGRTLVVSRGLRSGAAERLADRMTDAIKALRTNDIVGGVVPIDGVLADGLAQTEARAFVRGGVPSQPIQIHLLA